MQGFDPSLVGTKYGSKLYVWDWDTKKLRQTLELGADGLIPLEVAHRASRLTAGGHLLAVIFSKVTAGFMRATVVRLAMPPVLLFPERHDDYRL